MVLYGAVFQLSDVLCSGFLRMPKSVSSSRQGKGQKAENIEPEDMYRPAVCVFYTALSEPTETGAKQRVSLHGRGHALCFVKEQGVVQGHNGPARGLHGGSGGGGVYSS